MGGSCIWGHLQKKIVFSFVCNNLKTEIDDFARNDQLINTFWNCFHQQNPKISKL